MSFLSLNMRFRRELMSSTSSAKRRQTVKIDSLDLKIIGLLQTDCRLSFSRIGHKTNVSVGTAYNRIRRLKANGLFTGCTTLIDSTKMGLDLTAVIFVQQYGSCLFDAEKKLAECANVIAVYNVTGEYDVAIIAKFKDREDLNAFIKKLASMPNVKRTITNVSLGTVKEDFRLRLSECE